MSNVRNPKWVAKEVEIVAQLKKGYVSIVDIASILGTNYRGAEIFLDGLGTRECLYQAGCMYRIFSAIDYDLFEEERRKAVMKKIHKELEGA